jgi:hypothetical protein
MMMMKKRKKMKSRIVGVHSFLTLVWFSCLHGHQFSVPVLAPISLCVCASLSPPA